MEVSDNLHSPDALHPGKDPTLPIEQKAEWALHGHFREKKNIWPVIMTESHYHPAHTQISTLTTLSHLPNNIRQK